MSPVVTLDLYEIADEWSHALAMLQAEPSEDERDEHTEAIDRYAELCSDLGLVPSEPETLRWYARRGVTIIRKDTFEDYAREFAEDIHGDIDGLTSFIDWSGYADAIATDYRQFTYDGHEWLARE